MYKTMMDYVPKADNIYLDVELRLLQLVSKLTHDLMYGWICLRYDFVLFCFVSNYFYEN